MNILAHTSLNTTIKIFMGWVNSGLKSECIFNTGTYHENCLPEELYLSVLPQICRWIEPVIQYIWQHWVLSTFRIFTNLTTEKVLVIIINLYISPTMSEAEHTFLCLLAVCISYSHWLTRALSYIKKSGLLSWCVNSPSPPILLLYVLDPLVEKFYIFMWINSSLFSFMASEFSSRFIFLRKEGMILI